MNATLLFLPRDGADADPAWHWLRLADGAVVDEGEGLPEPGEDDVVAVAPVDAVALHWSSLPDRSQAQAVAAARIVVADAVAEPIEALHVAVGRADAGERPIGVVAASRMHGWLALLGRTGIDPAAILPAPLLLPAPDEGYVRADIAGQGIVRGATSGFADEARLSALVTGGATPQTIGRGAIEAGIVAAVASPILDLRQGPFARRRRRAIDWRLVRRLGAIAGLILLATLAIDLVRVARYSLAADAAEARAESLARTALPRGSAGDADRLLGERLARARGPGAGFSATAAAVAAAVQATGGSEVTALDFTPAGDLRVGVAAAGEAEVNALVARLRVAGFDVAASTFEASGGRVRGELTVTAP